MDLTLTNHRLPVTGKQYVVLSNALIILFLTLMSVLGINQYEYGTVDHEISVPFLKKFMDASLYPDDFLIAEIPYFYTYFWPALAFIINTLNIEITTLFFAGYLISVYATFVGIYMISMQLFKRRDVAILAMIFLIFSVPTLGATNTIENMFITRTVVLPVLLFSIYYFLKEKYLLSFFLQGVSFIIHPLSTAYVCAILFVASLVTIKHIGVKRLLMGIGLVILFASPVLIWKALYPAPSLHFLQADQQWLDLLRLRSSHHVYPFTWAIFDYVKTVLFFAGFFLTWKYKPIERHHEVVRGATLAVFLLCIAGIVFTEFLPLSIVIQFQLFRSIPFITYIAFIYFANYFIREIEFKSSVKSVLLVALLFASIYIGIHPMKMAGALAVMITFFAVSIPSYKKYKSKHSIIAMLSIVLILGLGGYYLHKGFTIHNAQETHWLNVQHWAKQNSDKDDVFVVSPFKTGFRVNSDRSIYGDWKDGTQMFFNPSFGTEWIRRMEMLGYTPGKDIRDTYNSLDEAAFIRIVEDVKKTDNEIFIVVDKDRKALDFPIAYKNNKFTVYKAIQ